MTPLVIRIGVDLVDVDRLRRMMEASGDPFLETAWTPKERVYCSGRAERLATRWAAKEAAMKALGIGVGDVSPLDVEVESIEGRAPSLVLHRGAAEESARLGISNWSVSLSHEGSWAIAFVVGSGGTS